MGGKNKKNIKKLWNEKAVNRCARQQRSNYNISTQETSFDDRKNLRFQGDKF